MTGHWHQAEIISGSRETGTGTVDHVFMCTSPVIGYYHAQAVNTGMDIGNQVQVVNTGVKDTGKEAKKKIFTVSKMRERERDNDRGRVRDRNY